jgi:WD40 repeat protein
MWDAATGDPLGELNGSGASGWDVLRFSPDGALLAVPSYPKGFGVWKATTREFVGRFDGDGVTVRSVAFSPDSRLLACGKEDGSVELWQVKGWKVVGKGQGPPGRVLTLRFSAAGRTLISGHEDTTALVWDVPKLLATPHGKNIQREGK